MKNRLAQLDSPRFGTHHWLSGGDSSVAYQLIFPRLRLAVVGLAAMKATYAGSADIGQALPAHVADGTRQPLAAHVADGPRQPLDAIPCWGPRPSSQGVRFRLCPHSKAAPAVAGVVPGCAPSCASAALLAQRRKPPKASPPERLKPGEDWGAGEAIDRLLLASRQKSSSDCQKSQLLRGCSGDTITMGIYSNRIGCATVGWLLPVAASRIAWPTSHVHLAIAAHVFPHCQLISARSKHLLKKLRFETA